MDEIKKLRAEHQAQKEAVNDPTRDEQPSVSAQAQIKPKTQKSKSNIPKTSGQYIGWKVGTESKLNPFGKAACEAAPRQDLAKNLGWPGEALL